MSTPRLMVQGTTEAAVQYGVQSYLERQYGGKFSGDGERPRKRRRVRNAAVAGCLAYQATPGGGEVINVCASGVVGGPTVRAGLRKSLEAAAWQSVRASIGGFLLTWFAGWIVSLVVDLLLEWFLSAESEGYRSAVAKGDA